ncbi:MAG: phage shock protein C [Algoriphagus sp.]|jgi:phage shock protein C
MLTKMKKLFRIKGSEKMLGGVAAGLAAYIDIDVTLIRVLLAVGFFSPIPVVLIYIILWIAMPAREGYELTIIKESASS